MRKALLKHFTAIPFRGCATPWVRPLYTFRQPTIFSLQKYSKMITQSAVMVTCKTVCRALSESQTIKG
jgi:hypothetical protein